MIWEMVQVTNEKLPEKSNAKQASKNCWAFRTVEHKLQRECIRQYPWKNKNNSQNWSKNPWESLRLYQELWKVKTEFFIIVRGQQTSFILSEYTKQFCKIYMPYDYTIILVVNIISPGFTL